LVEQQLVGNTKTAVAATPRPPWRQQEDQEAKMKQYRPWQTPHMPSSCFRQPGQRLRLLIGA